MNDSERPHVDVAVALITDANGHVTNFDYDAMGRLTKTRLPVTTPPNDSPTTSYDARGRVWRVTNPNGTYWEHKYDGAGLGNLVRIHGSRRRYPGSRSLGHDDVVVGQQGALGLLQGDDRNVV